MRLVPVKHFEYATGVGLSSVSVNYLRFVNAVRDAQLEEAVFVNACPRGEKVAETLEYDVYAADDVQLELLLDFPGTGRRRNKMLYVTANPRYLTTPQHTVRPAADRDDDIFVLNVGEGVRTNVQVAFSRPGATVRSVQEGPVFVRKIGSDIQVTQGHYRLQGATRRRVIAQFPYRERRLVKVCGEIIHNLAYDECRYLNYMEANAAVVTCISPSVKMLVTKYDQQYNPVLAPYLPYGVTNSILERGLLRRLKTLRKVFEAKPLVMNVPTTSIRAVESMNPDDVFTVRLNAGRPHDWLANSLSGNNPRFTRSQITARHEGQVSRVVVYGAVKRIDYTDGKRQYFPRDTELTVEAGQTVKHDDQLGYWSTAKGDPLPSDFRYTAAKWQRVDDILRSNSEFVEIDDKPVMLVPPRMVPRDAVYQGSEGQPLRYIAVAKRLYDAELNSYPVAAMRKQDVCVGNIELAGMLQRAVPPAMRSFDTQLAVV